MKDRLMQKLTLRRQTAQALEWLANHLQTHRVLEI